MMNLLNREECGLGFALNKMLTQFNMKPVLTRPQHRFYTDLTSYFEIDVDIHQFPYLGRMALASMRLSAIHGIYIMKPWGFFLFSSASS